MVFGSCKFSQAKNSLVNDPKVSVLFTLKCHRLYFILANKPREIALLESKTHVFISNYVLLCFTKKNMLCVIPMCTCLRNIEGEMLKK